MYTQFHEKMCSSASVTHDITMWGREAGGSQNSVSSSHGKTSQVVNGGRVQPNLP